MPGTLRILQVEDSESDAELIVRQLEKSGYDVAPRRAEAPAEMRAALRDSAWDLITCDYEMPEFDASAALAILKETGLDIPFIVISGAIGEEVAVAMMKAGAQDYLMKGNLARLGAAVERELRDARVRAERKRALEGLRESEAQLAFAIESTETGIFDYNPSTGAAYLSDLARKHLRWPGDLIPSLESFLDHVHPEDRTTVEQALRAAMAPDNSGRYEAEYRLKTPVDEEYPCISAQGRFLFDTNQAPTRFLGVVRDITRRRKKERQLRYQVEVTARITEQSVDGIALTDRDGNVRFVNAGMERIFGFTAAEFGVATLHDLIHHHYPDGRPYPSSECRLMPPQVGNSILRDHEDVYFDRTGSALDVAVSCAPLEMNGESAGLVYRFRDITEQKRAERAIRESDARFRRLFEADIIGILVFEDDRILECNDHFLNLVGFTRDEFLRRPITSSEIVPPEMEENISRILQNLRETGVCPAFEMEFMKKDGARFPVLYAAVELDRSSAAPRRLSFVVDLTAQKTLEKQFRQAQKLESIGLLAGGVAHDFNNLLTVILGYTNVALGRLDCDQRDRRALEEVAAAASRAAGLTRQLLTFSRWNAGTPKTISLAELVGGTKGMLQRLIGENIEVTFSSEPDTGFIRADPGLIEQVVLNLAVNARDAMPDGGKLLIETSRSVVADDLAAQCFSVARGTYACLTMTDTGTGMTPEVRARLFEPFFTTKEPGKGTGLGLSTVLGIVEQASGAVRVHSTPGIGTCFRIFFPALNAEASPGDEESEERLVRGTETVLLVEDEPGVRSFVYDVLEANGYRVLDARIGGDAMEIVRHYEGPIHILVTDLGLPGMPGTELIRRFRELRPGIPALSMSGYPARFGLENIDIPLLQKPFTPYVLLKKIRETLGDTVSSGHGIPENS